MRSFWHPSVNAVLPSGSRKLRCCVPLLLLCLGSALSVVAQEASPSDDSAVVSATAGSASAKDDVPVVNGSSVVVSKPLALPPIRLSRKYDMDRIGDRGVGDGFNIFSLNRERAMGESLAHRFEAHSQLVTDPEVNAYVTRVVQHLAINSDAKVPFTVKVVKNGEINVISLPGGFLYVNSGLITACPDEATFVGFLAHEVAHVAARHVTKTLTRRTLLRLGTIPLLFFTGGIAAAIDNAAGFAMPLTNAKFVRDSEREADLLGIEYTYAAGYDPEAFVQFFEMIAAQQKFKGSKFLRFMFASHPMSEDRVKRAQAVIATLLPDKQKYVLDTSDFQQFKLRLLQLNDQTCRDANNKPVMLGSGKQCANTTDADGRPKLQKRK